MATTGPAATIDAAQSQRDRRRRDRAARLDDEPRVAKEPRDRADHLRVRDGDDLVDELLHVLEREIAGAASTSAHRRCSTIVSSVTGRPASSDRVIFGAPSGSTPMTRTCGARCLIAAATPDDKPAAADFHEHRRHIRTLIEDLEPDGPLPGDDHRMIERRHDRQSALRRHLLGADLAVRATSCPRRRPRRQIRARPPPSPPAPSSASRSPPARRASAPPARRPDRGCRTSR